MKQWVGVHTQLGAPVGHRLRRAFDLPAIAASTELSRKQVASVFEALSGLIATNLGRKGPGMFVVPGLLKIMVIQKPATKAHKGINPFTKEEVMFKAKPARKVIKMRPLKALKDMAT